jgi:hypothetical protein
VLEFDVEEGMVVVSGSMTSVWEGSSRDSDIAQQREGKKGWGGESYNRVCSEEIESSVPIRKVQRQIGNLASADLSSLSSNFSKAFRCCAAVKRLPPGTPASAPLSPFLNGLSETRPAPKTYSGFTFHSTRRHHSRIQ